MVHRMSFYFVEVVFLRITMRARPGASHSHQGVACLFRSLLSCDTCVAVLVCVDRWALDREEVSVADRRDCSCRVAVVTDSGYCARNCRGKRRLLGAGWPIGDSGCRFGLAKEMVDTDCREGVFLVFIQPLLVIS